MQSKRRTPLRALWRSVRMRPRLYFSTLVGLGVLLLLPHSMSTAMRGTLAWNAGGLIYLIYGFRLIQKTPVDAIRKRAAQQDDGAFLILVLILLGIFASFAAIGGLINDAKQAKELLKLTYVGLAALTIFVSWTVMQLAFTMHYAHEYYQPEETGQPVAGLAFPSDDKPDFWDFFYFATSIGATSQTSDVSIKSKPLRRIVTLHAIVSFFFNTTVLALTINLAASLI
jgi:uncharacterized membrane protein